MNQAPKIPSISDLGMTVRTSPEFRRQRAMFGDITNESPTQRRLYLASCLGVAAGYLIESGRFNPTEEFAINIIGTMDPFLDSKLKIDEAKRTNSYDRRLFIEDKKNIVRFNKAVGEFMGSHKDLTRSAVKNYIGNTYNAHYGIERKALFVQGLDAIITGMRTENSADQIFDYIPDLMYESGAIDDDLNGIDKIITYKNKVLALDLKTTKEAAIEANEEAALYGNFDYYAYSFNIPQEDYPNDKMYIKPEQAEQYAKVFQRHLPSLIGAYGKTRTAA